MSSAERACRARPDVPLLSKLALIARNVLSGSAGLYLRALAATLAAVALFFAMSFAATFVSRDGIVASLERANAQHVFSETYASWTPRIPRFAVNDCAFLAFLLQDYPNRLSQTISVRIPDYDHLPPGAEGDPTVPGCRQLIASLERLDHADPQARWYHRYLHGQRVFAGLALAIVSPQALGWLTLIANVLLLLAVLIPALRRFDESARERSFTAIATAMLLFDALWLYGIYFSFGLSDLVLSAFLTFAYYRGLAHAPERSFAIAVALFGTATAIFEFLTGGIPFGLALLFGVIALDGPSDRDVLLRRAIHGGVIFALAIALTFAIKLALVMLFIDQNVLADFGGGLSTRVGASFVESLPPKEVAWVTAHGIDVSSLGHHWAFAVLYMLARLGYATFVIGYGSPVAGIVIMLAAVVTSAALLIRRARAAGHNVARTRLAILFGSALVMPVWSMIFLNHTLLHAIWMVRPFAWFVALAGILLCWRENPMSQPAS